MEDDVVPSLLKVLSLQVTVMPVAPRKHWKVCPEFPSKPPREADSPNGLVLTFQMRSAEYQ